MSSLAILVPWLIVALCCWVGYNLVRQNGRILLRLQTMEQQLSQLRLGIAAAPEPAPAPAVPPGLPMGSIAPSFELPDLQGKQKKLSRWSGRKVLLIFFNPQCGFCVRLAPDIAALPRKTLMPLVVSTGDLAENQKLVAEYGIECPVLLQKQMKVAAQYQVSGTPIGYVVDEQGRIASGMAVGADALLALAREANGAGAPIAAAHGNGNGNGAGHAVHKGNRDLSASSIKRDGLAKGTTAPAFRIPLLDGGELELADYRGRPVLLVFSDPGCGPCQELAPRLDHYNVQNRGTEVIMISRGDREANRLKVQEHGLRFPVALQKQWEISRLYGMFATPIGYLIDEEGIIAADVAVGAEPIMALLSNHSAPSKPVVAAK